MSKWTRIYENYSRIKTGKYILLSGSSYKFHRGNLSDVSHRGREGVSSKISLSSHKFHRGILNGVSRRGREVVSSKISLSCRKKQRLFYIV